MSYQLEEFLELEDILPIFIFEMKGKKGQMGNIVPIVSTVALIGILVASGFVIMQEFTEQDELKNLVTVTNGTTTAVNTTGFINSNEDGVRTEGFVLTAAWDNSSGDSATLPVANLTMNGDSGTIVNATTNTNGGGNAYNETIISYTYQRGDTAYLAVNDTVEGMQTVPSLLGVVILILLVSVVLAIVFNMLPSGRTVGA